MMVLKIDIFFLDGEPDIWGERHKPEIDVGIRYWYSPCWSGRKGQKDDRRTLC